MKRKKPDLYYVLSFIQALVVCIKALHAAVPPTVAVFSHAAHAEEITAALRRTGLFGEVKLLRNISHLQYHKIEKWYTGTAHWSRNYARYFKGLLRPILGPQLDLKRFRKVYLFVDSNAFPCWLRCERRKYHVLEDAVYWNWQYSAYNFWGNYYQRTRKQKLLFYWTEPIYKFGKSFYCKSVEVSDAAMLHIPRHKIRIWDSKVAIRNLPPEHKELLYSAFTAEIQLRLPEEEEAMLLLTQPVSDFGVATLEGQIGVMRELMETHGTGLHIVIKPHPRDRYDYKEEFKDNPRIDVLPAALPMEILEYGHELHFKRAVTITSFAIDTLTCAEEKIKMGYEWGYAQKDKYPGEIIKADDFGDGWTYTKDSIRCGSHVFPISYYNTLE
ncbi:MAG: alpha-2,8-polysialyltransferase family protein [Oscillospiraceae bacterium]|jgi:hypothetical protein|nr:alpha-2,8-polysialyltransferase family protein [Oscillospiraceae bacterium]